MMSPPSDKPHPLTGPSLGFDEILAWLREQDEGRLRNLWDAADDMRRRAVGDEVHFRGLLEISNHCVRRCTYCGLAADTLHLRRYRMTAEEILAGAREAASYDYGTVVMQAGEDYGIEAEWLADVVRRIKSELGLAVTLSMGERPPEDLRLWRQAGADRYLLRFETSDLALYGEIHPPLGERKSDRFALLEQLRQMGYEIGSGVMIGIPGQSYESLAHDLCMFRALDLDMVGVGPYIPHPDTPLGRTSRGGEKGSGPICQDGPKGASHKLDLTPFLPPHKLDLTPFLQVTPFVQVPATELMTYKVVALARLVCPQANIPSTTALATINTREGRELGLCRGANVVMPNVTPVQYRELYQIYPAKACIAETARECHSCLMHRVRSIGRTIGKGPGGRRR